jgi:hypothetical protein
MAVCTNAFLYEKEKRITTDKGGQAVSEEFFKSRTGQLRLLQLERELNAANDRIKRLEEALAWYEYTVLNCYCHGSEGDAARDALRKDQGRKAKEAKL